MWRQWRLDVRTSNKVAAPRADSGYGITLRRLGDFVVRNNCSMRRREWLHGIVKRRISSTRLLTCIQQRIYGRLIKRCLIPRRGSICHAGDKSTDVSGSLRQAVTTATRQPTDCNTTALCDHSTTYGRN